MRRHRIAALYDMNETTNISAPSINARLDWKKLGALMLFTFCLVLFVYSASPLYAQTIQEQSSAYSYAGNDAVVIDPETGRPIDELIAEEQAQIQSVRDQLSEHYGFEVDESFARTWLERERSRQEAARYRDEDFNALVVEVVNDIRDLANDPTKKVQDFIENSYALWTGEWEWKTWPEIFVEFTKDVIPFGNYIDKTFKWTIGRDYANQMAEAMRRTSSGVLPWDSPYWFPEVGGEEIVLPDHPQGVWLQDSETGELEWYNWHELNPQYQEAVELQLAEPTIFEIDPVNGSIRHGDPSMLDDFSGQREVDRQRQVDQASQLSQQQHDLARAVAAGDRHSRIAHDVVEASGRDAQAIADQAARESARRQQQESWETVIADVFESGLAAGGQALGGSLGREVGKEIADNLFDSEEPKRGRHDNLVASPSGSESSAEDSGTASGVPSAASDDTAPIVGEVSSSDVSDSAQGEDEQPPRIVSEVDRPVISDASSDEALPEESIVETITPAPTEQGPTQAQIDAAYRDGRDWRRTVEAAFMSQPDVQAGTRERYGQYTHPDLRDAFRRGYAQ